MILGAHEGRGHTFSFGVLLCVLLLLLSACGGGNSSTGTQGTAFRGTLSLAPRTALDDAQPLEGVSITLVDTGASTRTQSDGSYILQSTESLTTAEFFFFGSGVNASFTVSDIPEGAISVVVDFEVNQAGDTVVSTGVVVAIEDQEGAGSTGP